MNRQHLFNLCKRPLSTVAQNISLLLLFLWSTANMHISLEYEDLGCGEGLRLWSSLPSPRQLSLKCLCLFGWGSQFSVRQVVGYFWDWKIVKICTHLETRKPAKHWGNEVENGDDVVRPDFSFKSLAILKKGTDMWNNEQDAGNWKTVKQRTSIEYRVAWQTRTGWS